MAASSLDPSRSSVLRRGVSLDPPLLPPPPEIWAGLDLLAAASAMCYTSDMSANSKQRIVEDNKAARRKSRVNGRRCPDVSSHQTSEQTHLPSIDSVKLSGESGIRTADSRDRMKVLTTQSLYPRLSGTTTETCNRPYESSSSSIASPNKYQSANKHGRRSRSKVDDVTAKEERSCEKMRARTNLSTNRLSLEPLQLPEVDLKSPLPKLCDLSSPRQHRISGSQNSGTAESWEPFSCVCQHCGLKFGKHSIAIHERRCSHTQVHPLSLPDENVGALVARIVTIGLGSTQCEQLMVHTYLPPRPKTQTLQHSSLRDSGYGLPYIPSTFDQHSTMDSSVPTSDTSKHGMTLCDRCGMVIAADRVNVHSRLCKLGTLHKISTGSVGLPSSCDLLKVEKKTSRQVMSKGSKQKISRRKPPTVVCYICGREYGTKSIAIHEPQCLKKFETENRKLPISERKPLPKKPLEENTKVARLISMEEEMVAISGHPTDTPYTEELMEERMNLIFQQCYADFKRELVPCKRCGRKFAPDRHEKHEPKCNAKPVSIHKSQTPA